MTLGMIDQKNQKLIENITYLASLVSSKETVDTDLDTLRVITAKYQPGESFLPEEMSSLRILQDKLEYHLIHEDPVRAFTKESLAQKVSQHFAGDLHFYQRPMWSLILIIVTAMFLACLPFVISNNFSADIKLQLAMSLFFFGTHCGNIWFFMAARRSFRKELRVAFTFLAVGVLLVGIVGAQLTLLNLFGFTSSPWTKYGGFLFLFPLSYAPLFIGVYLFAKQLAVSSWTMSLRALGVVCVVVALLGTLIPSRAVPGENMYFFTSVVGISLASVLIGWTAAIGFASARRLTPQYARAMKLLAYAFAIICGSGIALVFALVNAGHLTPLAISIALAPVLIAEPLELLAGFTFKKRSSE